MTRPDGAVAGTRSPADLGGHLVQITDHVVGDVLERHARPPRERMAARDGERRHVPGENRAELDPALRVLRLEGVDDLEQARRPSGGVHHADAQRAFQLQAGGRGTPECIPEGVTGRLELPEQALASLGQSRRNRRAANGPGDRGGQSSGPA